MDKATTDLAKKLLDFTTKAAPKALFRMPGSSLAILYLVRNLVRNRIMVERLYQHDATSPDHVFPPYHNYIRSKR
jgi:hypothetical protein